MKKIGILGGGQLGYMFEQNAGSYPVRTSYLDKQGSSVAGLSPNFMMGDITDYDDVLSFGHEMDVISIEIENVNIEALRKLESMGKTVIPSPDCLDIITDKGIQKDFYTQNNIPTSAYELHDDWSELETELQYPLFQKYRKGGYDGKGVQKISTPQETSQAYKTPSVFEEAVDVDYEIAVQVFKDLEANTVVYPVVKFEADPTLNLLDHLIFPADIGHTLIEQAQNLALKVAQNLPGAGVFSVEMFVDKSGKLTVNETAPRVHNSGHSTIEASTSSQFDQMLRILAGYPLAEALHRLSGIWNIIGPAELTGAYQLEGLDELLTLPHSYLHWYQKSETKPGRKLGHMTFLDDNLDQILYRINQAKSQLKITAP